MRKGLWLGLALALALGGTTFAAEEFSEVEYYRQLEEQRQSQRVQDEQSAGGAVTDESTSIVTNRGSATYAGPDTGAIYDYSSTSSFGCYEECDDTPPANVFAVIPQYFHSRNDKAKFKVGGKRLEMAKGRANGAGATLLYTRRVNDWFSFGLMYEYAFLNVTSGTPVERGSGLYNREDSRWHSNVVGFLPEFRFGDFGKLQLSVIQGFDRANGYEEVGVRGNRRDIDDYGTDVTSFMAWYEKDFRIGGGWTFTPYAGWRSLYVSVKDANDWSAGPGVKNDDNLWVHLVSGGFKLNYQHGAYGFNLRGGVSHRTTRDDVPGYGNRAVAPGVVQFSHRANMDKTVGSVGAGVSYAINRRAIVAAGYDGYFGKDTSSQMGTLSFIFPF